MSNSIVQRTSRVLTTAMMLALSSCGGGGSGSGGGSGGQSTSAPSGVSTPSSVATPPRVVDQSDLDIAQTVYGEKSRTPAGFYTESKPSSYQYVSTTQLKNADLDATMTDSTSLYELCTDDWNQAMQWSETSAHLEPTYADLVDTVTDERFFEFDRVRQGEPQFYMRDRVYRCAYLNRDSVNLRSDQGGEAGVFNKRPLTADELKNLSEYLWQFTEYNNFGHAVLKSVGASTGTELSHTLYIANLTRAGISAACDRVDVIAWRHRLDATTGDLQLEVQAMWNFGARQIAGVSELCSQ